MKAKLISSEKSGKVEYYNCTISVDGKELKMRVTLEDGVVQDYRSATGESDKWNQLSQDEKEAIRKEIRSYYNY